jgi:hypothetical protein
MRLRTSIVFFPLLFAVCMPGLAQGQAATEPFRDPSLPIEQRVDDLVSRLTLDEKIARLGQTQPAIPRLGIKSFTNFTEGAVRLGMGLRPEAHCHDFPAVGWIGRNLGPGDSSPSRRRRWISSVAYGCAGWCPPVAQRVCFASAKKDAAAGQ